MMDPSKLTRPPPLTTVGSVVHTSRTAAPQRTTGDWGKVGPLAAVGCATLDSVRCR